MLLAFREETKQPRRPIAGLLLLEFSPALEIWSDIYTCPISCLIVPQTFSSFVFYPPSLSFCHSARLFPELSLLHIMRRHGPYCYWLHIYFGTLPRKIAYPAFNSHMYQLKCLVLAKNITTDRYPCDFVVWLVSDESASGWIYNIRNWGFLKCSLCNL